MSKEVGVQAGTVEAVFMRSSQRRLPREQAWGVETGPAWG